MPTITLKVVELKSVQTTHDSTNWCRHCKRSCTREVESQSKYKLDTSRDEAKSKLYMKRRMGSGALTVPVNASSSPHPFGCMQLVKVGQNRTVLFFPRNP